MLAVVCYTAAENQYKYSVLLILLALSTDPEFHCHLRAISKIRSRIDRTVLIEETYFHSTNFSVINNDWTDTGSLLVFPNERKHPLLSIILFDHGTIIFGNGEASSRPRTNCVHMCSARG